MHTVDPTGWPGWVQVILIGGAIAAALAALIAFAHKSWTVLNLFVTRSNMLDALPKFIEDTTNTLADLGETQAGQIKTLAAQDIKIEEIHHEVQYNNGSSVKDATRRIEVGVKGVYVRLDAADADRAELRRDLEETRPRPIRKRTTKLKETP
jgi:hypothetical protein